jgi:hypothetical protein
MKRVLIVSLMYKICLANDSVLYGTADKPQINSNSYDIHQTYIEPNQGYQQMVVNNNIKANNDESIQQKQLKVRVMPANETKQSVNFKSDTWATDAKVERILKKAASDGKLGYVLDQAKQLNLPASVAVIPIVESNYNRYALSHKGAGGAWQLMPTTANNYGLSSQQRFSFKSSTQVAIQLLSDLYQEFNNWNLVFAAYNCGASCVKTALNKNPLATDIQDLSLPQETKNYVRKMRQLTMLIASLKE